MELDVEDDATTRVVRSTSRGIDDVVSPAPDVRARRQEELRAARAFTAAVRAYAVAHPVFRIDELNAALGIVGRDAGRRRTHLMRRLIRRGVVVRLVRGTYALAGEGAGAARARVPAAADAEPWAPASMAHVYAAIVRMRSDGILGYRSALAIRGVVPPPGAEDEVQLLSRTGWRHLMRFGRVRLVIARPPLALLRGDHCAMGTESLACEGVTVRVTGVERTLVDVFDRPRLVGPWEEILAGAVGLLRGYAFDWEMLTAYLTCLGRRVTAARVGWFLERGKEWNGVPSDVLRDIEGLRPEPGPAYWSWLDREREAGVKVRYAPRWKIIVPRAFEQLVDKGHGPRAPA